MYNLRYHIASLVAVFLALAVGLVLGSIVVERGTIDAQQASLIKSLQTDFGEMNAENKALSAQVRSNEEFESALAPAITKDALAGRTILVLVNAGRTDGLASVVGAVEGAGAQVAVATLQGPGLRLDQSDVASAANTVLGTTAEGDALVQKVAESLATEWAGSGARPMMDALVSANAMHMDGLTAQSTVAGIVVLASWDKQADAATVVLGSKVRQQGIATAGAEAYAASTGVAAAFANAGLDAVNDAGTPRGNYSLVMILAGRASGFFGTGSSTDAPFAPLTGLTAN